MYPQVRILQSVSSATIQKAKNNNGGVMDDS